MTSLIASLRERLTPSASSTDLSSTTPLKGSTFSTAKHPQGLFTPTNPEVDGDDCLQDCSNCTIHLPKKWSIDETDKLYGHVKGWSRHLLVATGKADWVRDVEDEKDSVMEAMGKHGGNVKDGRLMLSASNIHVPDYPGHDQTEVYGRDRPTTVLLLPAFKFVDNVTPRHVPELIESVINTASTNTSALQTSSGSVTPPSDDALSPDAAPSLPAGLSIRNCPHKYLVLLCSQGTRDARCGQSAPLIRRELERQLRPLGLFRDLDDTRPGGVGIYFISHVGGHKYSANMLIYRKEDSHRTVSEQVKGVDGELDGQAAQCIWLARVRPEDCENIVRFTILQGKVVKPESQLRGGFDRGKSLVSW
ncbi:hypothetical protein K431DRAFT_300658 [Polychaeton citri CBS 116435]|uniref:Sucrase/ferredoxin-like family protein n=1 Tax=Polychaeton citri CBS 116435 TaxID=1314669 RepID=A0A9P4UQQ3_9PEZI|nr:hypothetical protein K431DRAFT_300658 [Polychaeton citri CBS 116435]